MAFFQCDFYSEVLGIAVSINVIVPQKSISLKDNATDAKSEKYPVLYLLHGLSDDHTIWHRRTSIERYADAANIAVVMPSGNRSFYTDMAYGYRYLTFIAEELPYQVNSFFPISDEREKTFIAGNSMGGFGAFKIAMKYPEKFGAAASLSGALDMGRIVNDESLLSKNEFISIFGNTQNIDNTEDDLFFLTEKAIERAKTGVPFPALYACCGTNDFLYQDNLKYIDFIKRLGLDYVYEEEEDDHNWGYWDKKIQSIIKWLVSGKP